MSMVLALLVGVIAVFAFAVAISAILLRGRFACTIDWSAARSRGEH